MSEIVEIINASDHHNDVVYLDESERCYVRILHMSGKTKEKYSPENEFYKVLWSLHPKDRHTIRIYGKEMQTPRWQQAYIRDYSYSGTNNAALPLPDEFSSLLSMANKKFPPEDGGQFNQVLLNWYESGEHYISAHSDDERPIVKNSPIVTICLGGEGRIFRIRPRKNTTDHKYKRLDVKLSHGCILIMCGEMQSRFTHEVPKASSYTDTRISVTLRQFIR